MLFTQIEFNQKDKMENIKNQVIKVLADGFKSRKNLIDQMQEVIPDNLINKAKRFLYEDGMPQENINYAIDIIKRYVRDTYSNGKWTNESIEERFEYMFDWFLTVDAPTMY